MTLLERVFNISQYMDEKKYDVQSKELDTSPWTSEYLPELYVSSEKLNSQIARLIQILKEGKTLSIILGNIKSGKSYLINLLKNGLSEILFKYISKKKAHVISFTPNDIPEYSQSTFMQGIGQQVFGKSYSTKEQTKEQTVVTLKRYVKEKDCLIVLLIDDFQNENLKLISRDAAKLINSLKEHLACIITCNMKDISDCQDGMREGGFSNFSYSIRLPELTLGETYELIKKRMLYALNRSNIRVTDIFTERAIESAWINSKGNPWVLISILADAYEYSRKNESTTVDFNDVMTVINMYSRSPVFGYADNNDAFIIQQALNNFPQRERQVCEYLIQKDASAKELTHYLYGNLSSAEYRSKYMGTKSFLKRLKEKNVVMVKGKEGRLIIFGLTPKIKEWTTHFSEEKKSSINDEN